MAVDIKSLEELKQIIGIISDFMGLGECKDPQKTYNFKSWLVERKLDLTAYCA